MGERMHVVGTGDNPVYICKKKEIPKLFNQFFRTCFEWWNYYHNKVKPYGVKEWSEIDPDILDSIMLMENHFKNHFGTEQVIIKYLESIIKHIRALGGVK
jgi:hypothetical protein